MHALSASDIAGSRILRESNAVGPRLSMIGPKGQFHAEFRCACGLNATPRLFGRVGPSDPYLPPLRSTMLDTSIARLPLSNGDLPRRLPGPMVRRLSAVLAMATMVTTAQCADAATIAVTAERKGDTIDIHASAQLQADGETAWRVLTAYDRYADFIPDLRTSRIVARQGAIATVEQSGDARVGLFPVPLDVTLEIVEFPPTGLRSHAISGTLRELENSYTLTPGKQGLVLDYVGHVAPGLAFFGPIELQAVKQDVSRQFQALTDEIERQSVDAAVH